MPVKDPTVGKTLKFIITYSWVLIEGVERLLGRGGSSKSDPNWPRYGANYFYIELMESS